MVPSQPKHSFCDSLNNNNNNNGNNDDNTSVRSLVSNYGGNYRKANDSVPRSWMLKTLQMKKLLNFLETSTSNWKTTMKVSYNNGCITTDQIKI